MVIITIVTSHILMRKWFDKVFNRVYEVRSGVSA